MVRGETRRRFVYFHENDEIEFARRLRKNFPNIQFRDYYDLFELSCRASEYILPPAHEPSDIRGRVVAWLEPEQWQPRWVERYAFGGAPGQYYLNNPPPYFIWDKNSRGIEWVDGEKHLYYDCWGSIWGTLRRDRDDWRSFVRRSLYLVTRMATNRPDRMEPDIRERLRLSPDQRNIWVGHHMLAWLAESRRHKVGWRRGVALLDWVGQLDKPPPESPPKPHKWLTVQVYEDPAPHWAEHPTRMVPVIFVVTKDEWAACWRAILDRWPDLALYNQPLCPKGAINPIKMPRETKTRSPGKWFVWHEPADWEPRWVCTLELDCLSIANPPRPAFDLWLDVVNNLDLDTGADSVAPLTWGVLWLYRRPGDREQATFNSEIVQILKELWVPGVATYRHVVTRSAAGKRIVDPEGTRTALRPRPCFSQGTLDWAEANPRTRITTGWTGWAGYSALDKPEYALGLYRPEPPV